MPDKDLKWFQNERKEQSKKVELVGMQIGLYR